MTVPLNVREKIAGIINSSEFKSKLPITVRGIYKKFLIDVSEFSDENFMIPSVWSICGNLHKTQRTIGRRVSFLSRNGLWPFKIKVSPICYKQVPSHEEDEKRIRAASMARQYKFSRSDDTVIYDEDIEKFL